MTNTKINISTAVYTAVPTVHLVTKKSMNVTWARAVSVDPRKSKIEKSVYPLLVGSPDMYSTPGFEEEKN